MDGLIAEHGGRIANTAGDSVLAEFASVVNCVDCAVAIQQKLAQISVGVTEREALRFRIGIHVGDVMVRSGDLLGDGVNVAARVQALAEPGGVWISGRAYDDLDGRMANAFEDKGEQRLKNIARPLKVYRWSAPVSRNEPDALSDSERPSIAVLPFANMSGDPEQDYFGDGIVEDITTALSRVKWFFVIARNSSFTYKGRAVDVRQVGQELGVRYVLEGSIRRAGTRIRITGQLVEAATGNHLWADRFDGELADVFELQDRITGAVVAAIEPSLRRAEIKRLSTSARTEDLGAYDLYLRALSKFRSYSAGGYRSAEKLLREAVARDADFGDAWGLLTDCLGRLALTGRFKDPQQGKLETVAAARQAARVGHDNAFALSAGAWGLAIFGDQDQAALPLAAQALLLNPNSADVRTNVGYVYVYAGESEKGIEQFTAARRLNPLDPRANLQTTGLGMAHFFAGRFNQAEEWCRYTINEVPASIVARRYLAAALAHLGRIEEAQKETELLLKLSPSATVTLATNFGFQPWMREMLAEGLLKAGLPP
jgi:adenylate cyclase